jgi:hypothetical protein
MAGCAGCEGMSHVRQAIGEFEVFISETTTALQAAMERVERMKIRACQCHNCVQELENLQGERIPSMNASLALVRGQIALLRDQLESSGE